MSYILFEHTADVGIEATATDAETTLVDAAHALAHVIAARPVQAGQGQHCTERTFFVEAPDHESLLVAFLSEFVWLFEADRLLWAGGGTRITHTDDGLRAHATGNMVPFDPTRHGDGVEVKAITYHEVCFEPNGHGWKARAILDL